jgi:hypothetical protein
LIKRSTEGDLKNMSDSDLKQYLDNQMQNIKLAITKFKAEDAIVNKLIPELKAKNPSLNTDALVLAHKNEMAKRLLNEANSRKRFCLGIRDRFGSSCSNFFTI